MLTKLISERDKYRHTFFNVLGDGQLARNFKLLHLRWILQLDGYEKHWNEWSEEAEESTPRRFEAEILRNTALSRLWHSHKARNKGSFAVHESLRNWLRLISERNNASSVDLLMDQFAQLFHTGFAAHDYKMCFETAGLAEEILKSGKLPQSPKSHLELELISYPGYCDTYWLYLRATSVVSSGLSGEAASDEMLDILLNASLLRDQFRKDDSWQWLEAEVYDDGGGDEYPAKPYEIDLREKQIWIDALRTQIAFNQHDQLEKILIEIEKLEGSQS